MQQQHQIEKLLQTINQYEQIIFNGAEKKAGEEEKNSEGATEL